jgi:hypothetical protein
MTVVDWIAYRATFDLREEPGALAGQRRDLCGGRSVMSVPTATLNRRQRLFHDDGVFLAVVVVTHSLEAEPGIKRRRCHR